MRDGGAAITVRELLASTARRLCFPDDAQAPLADISTFGTRCPQQDGDVRLHDSGTTMRAKVLSKDPLLVLVPSGETDNKKYAHLGDSPVKRAADSISASISRGSMGDDAWVSWRSKK